LFSSRQCRQTNFYSTRSSRTEIENRGLTIMRGIIIDVLKRAQGVPEDEKSQ
jgi:hypothetical protein